MSRNDWLRLADTVRNAGYIATFEHSNQPLHCGSRLTDEHKDMIEMALRAAAERKLPMTSREELLARADRYLNAGSSEYASEIMRDMAEFIRPLPGAAQTGQEPVAWLYETWIGEDHWSQKYSDTRPAGNKWERNIRPLYLSPPVSSTNPRWEDRRVDETGPEYEARIGKLVTGTVVPSKHGAS